MGASIKGALFEYDGLVCSFVKSLIASANGWGIPEIDTLFGPFRNWKYANALRSNNVKKAIANKAITYDTRIEEIKFIY